MNKIFDNWKDYLLKEEKELALPNQKRKDINMTVQRLREVLTEVQDMAMRLEEIQNQLIEEYDAGTITYRPGREFRVAAKKLASADEYGSLASSLNRYIEVDVGLNVADKERKR